MLNPKIELLLLQRDSAETELRYVKRKLATTCHNCDPKAVEAFLGELLDDWCRDDNGGRCPAPACLALDADDEEVLHEDHCTFAAMLASRPARPGTDEAKP